MSTIRPFLKKIWLSSPTIHGEELEYVKEAFDTNWVTTSGTNINELEKTVAQKVGVKYAIGLSSGTASLHMAIRLAASHLYAKEENTDDFYGQNRKGFLNGHKVFCSDMTFAATINPVVYEGGEPVFIDTEYDTWNMDPMALERAFKLYPDVKLIVLAHLYGTPCKMDEIRRIAGAHGALIVEDAAESFGATYKDKQTGSLGDFSVISFNGNKIITGSSGGMYLTDDAKDAEKVRKWSTQSRENAPWYEHEELGYNYRMSNLIAGVARGQMLHLEEHIAQKKAIYERYKEGLKDLPVQMNPYDVANTEPNYWLSCLLINEEAMCKTERTNRVASYVCENGKSCPTEILETLNAYNVEGRPIWKPMHLQPINRKYGFVTREGIDEAHCVGNDIFRRGLCLPSDNKMTPEDQDIVIEIIRSCFNKSQTEMDSAEGRTPFDEM